MIRTLLFGGKRIRIDSGTTVCHPCKHTEPVEDRESDDGRQVPPWRCALLDLPVDWNQAMTLPARPSKCRSAERAAKRLLERKKKPR
jgi:hypothetical protein